MKVRLQFLHESAAPGEAGRVVWELPRLHVPPEVIVRHAGELGLYTVIEGHAEFTPVAGSREGVPAAVDLPPKSMVIVDGRFSVTPETPVKVLAD